MGEENSRDLGEMRVKEKERCVYAVGGTQTQRQADSKGAVKPMGDNSPGIVMSGVHPKAIPKASQSLVQLFNKHILVGQQSVGIGIVRINLKQQGCTQCTLA